MRQSDLDWWDDEKPFDRKAWINKTTTDDCARPGVHYLRGMMLNDLYERYGLQGMKQSDVRALLGPPDGHRQLKDGLGLWEYELGVWDYYKGNYLTLIFNGDKVQATNANGQFDDP